MASRLKEEEDQCCPVCLDICKDPVVLSCCHSFCQACVQDCWRETENKECPVCKRRHSEGFSLSLKNRSEYLCSLHSDKLTLFCLEHQDLVCVVCKDSEKHTKHTITTIDEAAQQHKMKFRWTLRFLQGQLCDYERVKVKCDETLEHIHTQALHTEKQIKEQFKKLHQFLEKEEEARVAAVREEEEQKSQWIKEESEALNREIEALLLTFKVTQDELREEDVSFLKNYKAVMGRLKPHLGLKNPRMPSGALIDQAKHLGNLSFNIWNKMKDMVSYTPVILDPNTAHCTCFLSDDLISVRRGEKQHLPLNPERFVQFRSVLGSEGFDSETHSWDVEVGDSPQWSLGVLTESLPREGSLGDILQTICLNGSKYTTCSPPYSHTVLSVKKKPQRIRLNLDCKRRKLSFSDADTNTHIHTLKLKFTDKVFPYFNTEGEVRILPKEVHVT
ncbi:E3 ubiquitin-protein ligase TRIM35-like [Cheilinus undulatus]|uniref:E3 ubiquitin-protein ligase TRIM35-like n=1 Tax=Cheilinus undulatus TaxID=241271 RepID=UPI001BD55DAF|nr:E3 ubiquitin-protein ligase TRIM35-like [Cheilinus undulatus]